MRAVVALLITKFFELKQWWSVIRVWQGNQSSLIPNERVILKQIKTSILNLLVISMIYMAECEAYKEETPMIYYELCLLCSLLKPYELRQQLSIIRIWQGNQSSNTELLKHSLKQAFPFQNSTKRILTQSKSLQVSITWHL